MALDKIITENKKGHKSCKDQKDWNVNEFAVWANTWYISSKQD